MGISMEQLTIPPAIAAGAPVPALAPLAMPEQDLRHFDRSRRQISSGRRVWFARLGLAATSLLLTVFLVHQMWLVLSVGELTGVERSMLGLFVINIAWVVFGAL